MTLFDLRREDMGEGIASAFSLSSSVGMKVSSGRSVDIEIIACSKLHYPTCRSRLLTS